MSVPPDRRVSSISSTCDPDFVSFQTIWCHPPTRTRIDLAGDAQKIILNLVLSPSNFQLELFSSCLSHISREVGDHLNFVQEEQQVLHCWTMILATCVVVDVSRCLDALTWEVSAMLVRLPFRLLADTASAACPAHPGSLATTSISFAVICDADDPCSVNTAWEPESSFTALPRRTTRPLYFWNFGSNSKFLMRDTSISVARWTVLPSFCPSGMSSFLLLTFVTCNAGNLSSFLHSFSTTVFASGIFIADELNPFPAMWSSWSLGKVLSKRFLVDSWPSAMLARFDLWLSDSLPQVSLYWWFLTSQGVREGGSANEPRSSWT